MQNALADAQQREHDGNDACDADHGHHRRADARGEGGEVHRRHRPDLPKQAHPRFYRPANASTIESRMPRIAGGNPLTSASPTASAKPTSSTGPAWMLKPMPNRITGK